MSPKQLSMINLLNAINALEIDVPIMRTEEDANGSITIYLYGGEIKHWPPTVRADLRVSPDPDGIRPDPDGVSPDQDNSEPHFTGMTVTPANPMPHFTPPPVTRSELKRSQRSKKSQTHSSTG